MADGEREAAPWGSSVPLEVYDHVTSQSGGETVPMIAG